MALLDDLCTFYPCYQFQNYNNNFKAVEPPANNVSLNEVCFQKPNIEFWVLDKELIKDLSVLYTTHEIFRKDCDALAIYEDTCQKHLIAVELKSTFSSQEIFKAFSQLVGSIYKWILVLNPIATFDRQAHTYTGYICTHDHPNKSACLTSLNKQRNTEVNSKGTRLSKYDFALLLYMHKQIKLKPSQCWHLNGFNLSQIGIFDELTIKLEIVPNKNNTHIINL